MARARAARSCPDCHEVPTKLGRSEASCGCAGRSWRWANGIAGTEEEEARLSRTGFLREESSDGDVYYRGPLEHILRLYEDETWESARAPAGLTMEGYLIWVTTRQCRP
jgi:hypothetical protein